MKNVSANGVYPDFELDDTDCLDPCPFCGSTSLELSHTHTPHCSVACTECETQGPSFGVKWRTEAGHRSVANHRKAAEGAIRLWNKRAEVSAGRSIGYD